MNYYTAPMEGLTDRIWRQVHQKWFGAAGAPARYYAPFLSPPENRILIKKKMAELEDAGNAGVPVVPAYFDYANKVIGIGLPFELTGDMHADIARIQRWYAPYKGRNHDVLQPAD